MEIIQQNSKITTSVRLQLSKVSRYVRQLNDLKTELLNFREIEQRKNKMRLSRHNLTFFLKEMFDDFSEYAKRHRIDYRFIDNLSECNDVWFDVRQMQKVLSNLLSNAFKFTPDGGMIILRVEKIIKNVKICVEDTGTRILNEDLPYVFNRFYQSEDITSSVDTRGAGTGIGLALAKNIVEQHHGNINVVSEIGKGTSFTVELPIDKSVYKGDTEVVWDETAIHLEQLEWNSDDIIVEDTSWLLPENGGDVKKILIVEDDVELVQMLYKLFTPLYEVVLASNGLEGLERVRDEVPDLVLSDVMMPKMSGFEMCRQIKSNLDWCHIPVILLTALDSLESNIEGLRMGADDYVTKPFDVELLLMRCNNMIRNRQLVKEKYTKQMDTEIVMLTTNTLDKKFLEDIVRVIDVNLDNVDFDIPFLCQEVGMSRTAFQRRFKALTNLTPNDFVIQYKLKKAADLLVHEQIMQIGEIADKLGFGSAKYFSRLFKKQFGISPLGYRKSSLLFNAGFGSELKK
ncbi:ATP-binding protein [uncultured Mediterranea sp.]|uniref:hybrid sensor histidine kinase/response regulator transcription factor n=1 Tax=uncultured Mediterranea sp. TaxID=1926662 RepID=UPI0027D936E3|nr:ATP-binding protein [uncultured Mediterranea sp.]